jgi:hypothetical protein
VGPGDAGADAHEEPARRVAAVGHQLVEENALERPIRPTRSVLTDAMSRPLRLYYLATQLVEGVGGPGHHVKGIGAAHRALAVRLHSVGDPLGRIGRRMGDLGTALRAEHGIGMQPKLQPK